MFMGHSPKSVCVKLANSCNLGLLDSYEGNADVDQDGIPNYLDLDSDGDGEQYIHALAHTHADVLRILDAWKTFQVI
jgi:hypothetical protein